MKIFMPCLLINDQKRTRDVFREFNAVKSISPHAYLFTVKKGNSSHYNPALSKYQDLDIIPRVQSGALTSAFSCASKVFEGSVRREDRAEQPGDGVYISMTEPFPARTRIPESRISRAWYLPGG
jgi:hypothetical protein